MKRAAKDLYPILLILALLLFWFFLGPETNPQDSVVKEWRAALNLHEAEIVCEAPKFPFLKKQACTISQREKSNNASSFFFKNEKLN